MVGGGGGGSTHYKPYLRVKFLSLTFDFDFDFDTDPDPELDNEITLFSLGMEARQNIKDSMQILNKQITRIKSDFLGSRTHFGLGIWTKRLVKISRYYFDGVLVSSFGILGIIGNILTLCVLSRPKFRVCHWFMIKFNIIKVIEQTGLLSSATTCLGLF